MNQTSDLGDRRGWSRTARACLIILASIVSMTFTAPVFGAPGSTAHKSVPGQFVVQLKQARSDYDFLERQLQGKIIDQVRPDMVLVQRDPKEPVAEAVKALENSQFVAIAEPNYIYKAVKTPNDPEYGRLWGLSNGGALDAAGTRGLRGVDIGAERAWDITTGSRGTVVAIIDTGIDFKIPDLANNAWTNQAEANGQPGVDDDGNGYIDDIHGFNFVNNTGDATDDYGHGSHCAGTIGAQGNDGQGVAGVNWNVSLMSVKFLDAAGGGTLANAVKAIDYARKNGAKILSNSWGGGGASEIVKIAIDDTEKAGLLFVAAAGNDGSDNDRFPTYPASFDSANIVSVAALDNRGELAYFSNFGRTSVDIAAPGVNVLSTTPTGLEVYSGTSMATPHVSGVAALLLSQHPDWDYRKLKERLLDSARPIRGLDGKMNAPGIVDAYYALTGLQPPPDPNDPSLWTDSSAYQISSPHPYPMGFNQTYTIQIPGAKRVSVHFSKFETESGYDQVQFFNSAGESIGSWSGNKDGRFGPIADGDTVVIKFTSDATVNAYGFDVDQVVFEK